MEIYRSSVVDVGVSTFAFVAALNLQLLTGFSLFFSVNFTMSVSQSS
jgi:hypothetical protein